MANCFEKPTISSLHIGHNNFVLAAEIDGPPFCKDTTELRSRLLSGNGEVAKGEAVESFELNDTVLAAGELRSTARECAGGAGGAKDFPLPRILPPPNFRPDIPGVYGFCDLTTVPGEEVLLAVEVGDLLAVLQPHGTNKVSR